MTADIRREMVREINSEIESCNPDAERIRLEKEYGQVWDTKEVQENFAIIGFLAPFVTCTRKSDGKDGVLEFQDLPRFYFNFQETGR